MSGIWGHLIGVVIVLLMLAFIGIWVWVWRPRHQRKFERLSKLPLEDVGARAGPDLVGEASRAGRGQRE